MDCCFGFIHLLGTESNAQAGADHESLLHSGMDWRGVAKWGGVTMRTIMEKVQPHPDAKYALFYSYGEGHDGGFYWDAHSIENMRHELSILAYELNGDALPVLHGAPLRLGCENELGFKMVKWIRAIEFFSDYSHIGSGQGGYDEDNEFFGYSDPI